MTAVHTEDKLGTEKIWKLCLTMGIPCVLAQLVNLLYNIVDRVYIGHMAEGGDVALAGLGLCAPIITLISAFSSFVSGGGAPLAAKALGEKNRERALKILGNGFFLLIVFSVVLGLVAYFARKPLLLVIGAREDTTLPYANQYLSIYLIGTAFVQLSVGLNTFLTAQGKSKSAMFSVLIGAFLNIGLDPLFIFVFDMGIAGAALATILSQFVSMVFVVTLLFLPKTSLHIIPKYIKPDIKILGAIFSLGLAPFVMAATESVIGFVLNGRLRYYGDLAYAGGGDDYISALAVLQSALMLISVPISGFTQGVTPILSYNFGAKNKARLKNCYFLTLAVCFGYCALMGGMMIAFPHGFGSLFTDKQNILSITDRYFAWFVFGMFVFGIQRACQTTFVAMGEAIISLFIAILRKIILLVPFAFLFPLSLGVGGVYLAEGVADSVAATLCGCIFFFRFRAILRKLPQGD
jgi:putative MATE family efflux protein